LVEDSVAQVKAHQAAEAKLRDTVSATKTQQPADTTGFNLAFVGTEHLTTVENDLMKVVFSNKGGQPVSVELKNFKSYDSTPVKLVVPGTDNRFSYAINTAPNQSAQIADLYFSEAQVTRNADGSQTIVYRLPAPSGESLEHRYT